MSTHHVGDIIEIDNLLFKVVEEETCHGCFFQHHLSFCIMDGHKRGAFGPCDPHFRDDGKSVIFKEIE